MGLERIINKLLSVRRQPLGTSAGLSSAEIIWLCQSVRQILLKQPTLLELSPPICICGDVHGQYHDLLRIFEVGGCPPSTNYLFLGDYVDRGRQGIESVCLLFAFKICYPENFFILRGNHECSYINRQFTFYEECVTAYNQNIWHIFCDVFNCLPIAATIDDRIFCVHGGLSPSLKNLDNIRAITRPVEIPEEGLLCDLLWSDPDINASEWEYNERGTSFIFGDSHLEQFLAANNLQLVCRAHQVVAEGYSFPLQGKGLVTIFSAPNYCDFGNKGAMMMVGEDLACSFTIIEPVNYGDESAIASKEQRVGTPPRHAQVRRELRATP